MAIQNSCARFHATKAAQTFELNVRALWREKFRAWKVIKRTLRKSKEITKVFTGNIFGCVYRVT